MPSIEEPAHEKTLAIPLPRFCRVWRTWESAVLLFKVMSLLSISSLLIRLNELLVISGPDWVWLAWYSYRFCIKYMPFWLGSRLCWKFPECCTSLERVLSEQSPTLRQMEEHLISLIYVFWGRKFEKKFKIIILIPGALLTLNDTPLIVQVNP